MRNVGFILLVFALASLVFYIRARILIARDKERSFNRPDEIITTYPGTGSRWIE